MANGHGGSRPGAGRPLGSRDTLPGAAKKYDKLKSMAAEYDTNEYLITNESRVFVGNALELMTGMYKASNSLCGFDFTRQVRL
jgi:hypothetical protein